MIERKFTCPFTGITYDALESEIGHTLIIKNPMDNTLYHYQYDYERDCYLIPYNLMTQYVELVTPIEASYILNTTRQRMSQIANAQTIRPIEINGHTYFRKSDVLEYKENRKTGRPRKELDNGTDD